MRYGSQVAEYLAQARHIDGLIQAKLEQIAQLRASITRGTAMLSDMPRGGPMRDWTDTAARVADMETELREQINLMIDIKGEITEAIMTVQDMELRTLLNYRYLTGWSWGRIADAMHYDRATIWRKHKEAMAAVQIPKDKLQHRATQCNT